MAYIEIKGLTKWYPHKTDQLPRPGVPKKWVKALDDVDLSIEKDYYGGKAVWEIEFDAKKKGNGWCEYDYKISRSSGKILFHDEEYDD